MPPSKGPAVGLSIYGLFSSGRMLARTVSVTNCSFISHRSWSGADKAHDDSGGGDTRDKMPKMRMGIEGVAEEYVSGEEGVE